MHSVGGPLVWSIFAAVVIVMLVLDLGVFHRRAHVVSMREATIWSLVWVSLALLFNLFVYSQYGADRALEFFQAWLIEEALSVDNIFVFLVIFSFFAVPSKLQHRVLFWGILGAVVMRGAFITIGAALLAAFHWVIYVFGIFLVITAGRLLMGKGGEDIHPEKNFALRILRRVLPITREYEGSRFLVRRDGRLYATPLLVVLVVVEATDVVFAVDSIPAVFGVTTDVFIVYTSNIFAVLGLRALFFVVASLLRKLHYLRIGLALVLGFVGAKMLFAGLVKVPNPVSLSVVAGLLLLSAVASLLFPSKALPPLPEPPKSAELPAPPAE